MQSATDRFVLSLAPGRTLHKVLFVMQHYCEMLALAGPAESAFAMELMIEWAGLAAITICSGIAFWKASWIATGVAVALFAVATVLFMPWQAFAPLTAQDLEDPDVQPWVDSYRHLAVAWIFVGVLLVACLVLVKMRRSRRVA